jgi:hypothetical protein
VAVSSEPDSTEARSGRMVESIALVARWVLGAVFIYMGLTKALHPEQFL